MQLRLLLACLFCLGISMKVAYGQEFTSSLLPIIKINTDGAHIVDDPKIIARMGIIYNGEGNLNHVNDPFNHYDGHVAIEIRGSSSQQFPKKQYSLELRRKNGEDLDTALLGLPNEEDWILFAPYNDKTLMRDFLAYKLGAETGRYAPRTKYCEVFLNGDYQGVYMLIEKIKRGKDRVNIRNLKKGDNSGEDLSGGYIIKIDKSTGNTPPGWRSKYPPGRDPQKYIEFFLEEPDPSKATSQQKAYIQNFIATFEDVLKSASYNDPIDGYTRYIDVDSFVDYFIINEISKNTDGYRLSTFFHKQHVSDGGKLVMGPIWDYNLGFGNANYCIYENPATSTKGFAVDFNAACPDDFWQVPFWWRRLLSDKRFADRLHERWTELRSDRFTTERVLAHIDSIATLLTETGAQQRNFQRWPVLGEWVWPNQFVGQTYNDEVSWLKNWVVQRMEWLDNEIEKHSITGVVSDTRHIELFTATPNPFSKSIMIGGKLEKPAEVQVELINTLGNVVDHVSYYSSNGGQFQIEVGEMVAPSFYICRITVNRNVEKVFQVIKK